MPRIVALTHIMLSVVSMAAHERCISACELMWTSRLQPLITVGAGARVVAIEGDGFTEALMVLAHSTLLEVDLLYKHMPSCGCVGCQAPPVRHARSADLAKLASSLGIRVSMCKAVSMRSSPNSF
eukprot:6206822-Pleurochrysis_carterae.AAC.1